MKLHDWIRDSYFGTWTPEEFACLLVAAGYCPKHITEPSGNDAEGWMCVPCEAGLPGVYA